MIITLAYLKCWLSVNERRNILVGVTHPLEQSWQDSGRAKTRRTAQRKIAATDNRGPKTASCVSTEKGVTWSSAFPINSQRLPMASRALCRPFFRSHCTERKGHVASPLVQMEPPHAINSYSYKAIYKALPHKVIHRISPSQPGVCYEALTLPLAVLKLGALCVHHHDPLSLVPPEISTCVCVLITDLDLCMHLLNVRLQPDSLSGREPPTGRYGWWVLLPAVRSTKFFRSALSHRILQGSFVLRLLPCRPHRVGDTRSALAAGTLLPVQRSRTVLVTPRQVSLNCPEPPYGLLEVDQNVRLVPAEREAVLVPLSVEGQGILELFLHPCKFPVGIVYKVIFHCLDFPESSQRCIRQFIYFRQEDPCLRGRAHPVM
ncbi:hypothetical protein T08_16121 [Trichinella sp. T8]|nr:hypothetical protein T08_16121 [Trichinella sp. T8]